MASTVVGTRGRRTKWPDLQRKESSCRRRQRGREVINEKIKKYRAKNGSLRNTSTDLKGTTFVIFINHASALVRTEGLNPTGKARREASRNKFVEKGGMPDRVKSFGEINGRQNLPRARPGFVKPIRNRLRKEQNLI